MSDQEYIELEYPVQPLAIERQDELLITAVFHGPNEKVHGVLSTVWVQHAGKKEDEKFDLLLMSRLRQAMATAGYKVLSGDVAEGWMEDSDGLPVFRPIPDEPFIGMVVYADEFEPDQSMFEHDLCKAAESLDVG